MSKKSSWAAWGCCSLGSGRGARARARPMALALYFDNARSALKLGLSILMAGAASSRAV
jgi:hypothetical protein